jgi:hypothetical protein
VSSKIDHESGVVTITAPVYSTMPVGHRLRVTGFGLGLTTLLGQDFNDYCARLALSQPSNGHAWGEGVAVQPPDGALLEAIENGVVHRSLVAEPNGNGAQQKSQRVNVHEA